MDKGHVPDYQDAIQNAKLTAKKISVDVPKLKRSHHTWVFQDTDNQDLIKFRDRFELEKIIENASDEWHSIRLIRNWVYLQNVRGGGDGPGNVSNADTESLMLSINAGASFWCTYFAKLMRAATLSLGWVSRHVAVGTDYDRWGSAGHHGVCEVWVNQFKKWVLIDAHFDTHYEIKGVPLSAYEIHRAAIDGYEKEVDHSKGPEGQLVDPFENGRGGPVGSTQMDTFFWHYYHLKNTPFSESGSWDFSKYILLEDDSHKDKLWYQRDRKKHSSYKDKFISEKTIDEVYFDVNSVYLEPKKLTDESANRGIVVFDVGTMTPNLKNLEIQLDNKTWQPQSTWRRVQWALHKGDNSFAIRTINKLGRKGPIARLEAKGVEFIYSKQNENKISAKI